MRRLALAVTALALSLGPAADAFADRAASAPAAKDPGALFAEAEAAYQAGRFQDAIDRLKEAQAIAPDPILLYNLARAYEALGELERARDAYRAFIEADPDTSDRGAIEGRICSLDALIEERAKEKPGAIEPARPTPTAPDASASPWPWIVAGVGVVGLGVGGALGGMSLGASSDAEDPSTSGLDASELASEAETLALGANVSFAVGGAIALAGVIWGIVDVVSLPASSEGGASVSFRVGPSNASVTVAFW